MKYILPFFVCVLLVSCLKESDCLVTATNYMRVQFKSKKTGADTVIIFAHRSVDVVEKNISLTYSAKPEILLPLDIDQASTSTTFIFHRINKDSTIQETDLIRVGYDMQAKVISKECGAYTYYQNLKITNTTLDSTRIKTFSKNLLKDPSTSTYALNFQIFY